ncbi:MAG: nuclear transport factor 2 family protein [Halioglobus sp.]|nr:nuclear transport factor 2 family protein [Halioglobus sp.]
MAVELEALARLEARLAIEDLNTHFCHYLDHNKVDLLVGLFTAEAYYAHGSRVSVGVEKIRSLFDARLSAGVRTARHMYSGLKVELVAADRARGTSVCMTFAQNAAPPITSAVPYLVADFFDEYVREDDGCWRIAKRRIERIFIDPSNKGPVGQTNKG